MSIDVTELEAELNSFTPSITEPMFRRDFLPFFTSNIAPNLIPTAVSAWVQGVAGSATVPVNVVDPKTGDVLFQVPGILDTQRVSITDPDQFEHAVTKYSQFKRNQPEMAEIQLQRELRDASSQALEIAPNTKWDPMLEYYGLKQVPPTIVEEEDLLSDLGL